MSHNGTGRYIPVRTSTRKCQNVGTRTYSTAYRAVQGSTERYRAVHEMVQGSTGQSTTRYKAVHGGTCQYTVCICAGPRAGGRPILVRFSNRCIDCTNSGFSFKSLHAQTRLFIPWRPCPCQCYSPPPLPPAGSGGGGGGWQCLGWRLASPSPSRKWRRHILIPCATGALGLRGGGGRDVDMWQRRGV